ncbi:MAG: rhodanese-like domain-containing protein [Lentisphaeria bacterium]|nr:rhodanese-like domain-containing protein [Lentisphaeria bacterium]
MKFLQYALFLSCAAAAVCGCACGNTESAANGSVSAGQPVKVDLNTVILLDVRSPEEYASGYLQGARNIPHDRIGAEIVAVVPDKSAQVILYCRFGRRANTALETLRAMGYTNVSNYGGLEDAQERLGLPVVTK